MSVGISNQRELKQFESVPCVDELTEQFSQLKIETPFRDITKLDRPQMTASEIAIYNKQKEIIESFVDKSMKRVVNIVLAVIDEIAAKRKCEAVPFKGGKLKGGAQKIDLSKWVGYNCCRLASVAIAIIFRANNIDCRLGGSIQYNHSFVIHNVATKAVIISDLTWKQLIIRVNDRSGLGLLEDQKPAKVGFPEDFAKTLKEYGHPEKPHMWMDRSTENFDEYYSLALAHRMICEDDFYEAFGELNFPVFTKIREQLSKEELATLRKTNPMAICEAQTQNGCSEKTLSKGIQKIEALFSIIEKGFSDELSPYYRYSLLGALLRVKGYQDVHLVREKVEDKFISYLTIKDPVSTKCSRIFLDDFLSNINDRIIKRRTKKFEHCSVIDETIIQEYINNLDKENQTPGKKTAKIINDNGIYHLCQMITNPAYLMDARCARSKMGKTFAEGFAKAGLIK